MSRRFHASEIKRRALDLAESLGSVSAACREVGMARSTFYAIKAAYECLGPAGLEPRPRKKPVMPNAFGGDTIQKILTATAKYPSYSSKRISAKLAEEGVRASGSGVRKVWLRHGLTVKQERVRRLKQAVAKGEVLLLSGSLVNKKE